MPKWRQYHQALEIVWQLWSQFKPCLLKHPIEREQLAFLFAAQVTHGNQIGEELFQERKHPKQGRHDENAAITILNIGQMDDGMKQQAQRIY